MNKLKKILLVLLALTLALSLFACGEKCTHKDEDGNGFCDDCTACLIDPLTLVDGGEAKFAIVLGNDIPLSVRLSANQLKTALKKIGVLIDVVDDGDETDADVEVLIGTVESRGEEYKFNKYSVGIEGYVVKIVGDKILIAGGSDDALEEAFAIFVEDVLCFDEDTEELTKVIMKPEQVVVEIYTDYDITSVKVGGNDMSNYVISTDFGDPDSYNVALELQNELYTKAGLFLPFVAQSEVSGNAIYIRTVDKDDTPEDSFAVYVKDGSLYIDCAYHNFLLKKVQNFIAAFITKVEGELNFENTVSSKYVYKEDISFVTYEMFGANGRDEKNDFEAIVKTHEFANISGQTVRGTDGATYYITDTRIGGKVTSAIIKTNVEWGTAKFEIIDTRLWAGDGTGLYAKNIFVVEPEKEMYRLSAAEIAKINEWKVGRDTTRLNVSIPGGALLNVIDADKKVYIRYGKNGNNANSGSSQHEIVLVDENGYILDDTYFLLDYDKVTEVEVYSINDTPLTISGGIFYTRASEVDSSLDDGTVYNQYFKRGISIQRSNTVIKDSEHYVTGQYTREQTDELGLRNPSYSAFYSFNVCNNVKLYNCIVTAKRGNGTYDIGATTVCNITFEKCTQSNFFLEDGYTPSTTNQEYWGVAGTNYCKNMTYKDSKLTRYDAHSGVYNGKIINCEIALIYLIGGGTMLVEDTTIYSSYVFSCRQDYGATWNGEVIVRNCTLKTASTTPSICYAMWTNHYYGYVCHYPSIELDNLKLEGTSVKTIKLDATPAQGEPPRPDMPRHTNITQEPNIHKAELITGETNVNPYAPPVYLKITNNTSGITFTIPQKLVDDGCFLAQTEIEGFTFK